MEQVLDVYKRRYAFEFPVICMDESPKQLIEEGKPSAGCNEARLGGEKGGL